MLPTSEEVQGKIKLLHSAMHFCFLCAAIPFIFVFLSMGSPPPSADPGLVNQVFLGLAFIASASVFFSFVLFRMIGSKKEKGLTSLFWRLVVATFSGDWCATVAMLYYLWSGDKSGPWFFLTLWAVHYLLASRFLSDHRADLALALARKK